MQRERVHDRAVPGVDMRLHHAVQRQVLQAQVSLTTPINLSANGPSTKIPCTMVGNSPVDGHDTGLIERITNPATWIVALTVTDGGYDVDPLTEGFDAERPDTLHDVANSGTPRIRFGHMFAFSRLRRDEVTGNSLGGAAKLSGQQSGPAPNRRVAGTTDRPRPRRPDWRRLPVSEFHGRFHGPGHRAKRPGPGGPTWHRRRPGARTGDSASGSLKNIAARYAPIGTRSAQPSRTMPAPMTQRKPGY